MNDRFLFGSTSPGNDDNGRWFDSILDLHCIDREKFGNQQIVSGASRFIHSTFQENGLELVLLGSPYYLNARNPTIANFDVLPLGKELARHGIEALKILGGSFALAAVLPSRGEFVLAVDRFAIENLYFMKSEPHYIFSNSTRDLALHSSVDNRFSRQAIFDYLYFHCIPGPETGYLNIERLLPGQCLVINNFGSTIHQYWEPRYLTERSEYSPQDLSDALQNAVDKRLTNKPTACFLSGGLDSSAITGLAAQNPTADITAVTIGFDAEGYDETEFARAVADKYSIPHETYDVTPSDIVEMLDDISQAFDAPFGNASCIPTYFCAHLAKKLGFTDILAGDGGDELFGGNTRYAKQLKFEAYHRLPRALQKSLIEPAIGNIDKIIPNRFTAKIVNYLNQSNIPLPARTQSYNLLNRINYQDCLSKDFLNIVDATAPGKKLEEIYGFGEIPADVVNRLLRLDWRITLADSDLMKVTRMCSLANIQVEFPMLDERVFEIAANLPTRQKVTMGELRPFYRKAFSHMLPESTMNKSKQGFGLPFGLWLQSNSELWEMAMEYLIFLENQNVISPRFRNTILKAKLEENAEYYGVFLWILISLAAWLKGRAVSLY